MFGAFVAILFSVSVPSCHCRQDKPVRVTVVVIVATTENNVVDYILTDLAKEVRKREPKLIGFKVSATECKSIPVGESADPAAGETGTRGEGGEAEGRRGSD